MPVPFDSDLSIVELPAVEADPEWTARLADAVKAADAHQQFAQATGSEITRRSPSQLETTR